MIRSLLVAAALAGALTAGAGAQTAAPGPAAPASAAAVPPPAPTAGSQRVYDDVRPRLFQIRTLLGSQDSQATVGSGFLVSEQGHFITNYHVVSLVAGAPERHRLVYSGDDGQRGALKLLAVDVINDLALVQAEDPAPLAGLGALSFRPAGEPLARGERIYALGNPLDVGFAVVEGAYNGLVERSYVPTIFFGGSLSSGMSGGPAVDGRGRVIGVNVAARRDGEQVSFLVPGAAAAALLQRARGAAPATGRLDDEITRQLLAHQQGLVERFLDEPWRDAGHDRYAIPVPQERYMRCWGSNSPRETRGLQFERSDCVMDSRVYVDERVLTGFITVRHEAYDGRNLGRLRFNDRYSASFQNEFFGFRTRQLTAPSCHEGEVQGDEGPPLRTVVCLRGYRRLAGLYDVSVLTATLDSPVSGAQGRFDAHGVSWENALRLVDHYLKGYRWLAPKTGSR